MKKKIFFLVALLSLPAFTHAGELTIRMHAIDAKGVGKALGTVTAAASDYGTIFTPELSGLDPGLHGFHVHEKPSCAPGSKGGKMVPGLGAGGHYDPAATGTHLGPYGQGHLGDLPPLYVNSRGRAAHPVLAPRIKLADLKGRAVIIHAGGDNYADHPKKLGGGGARVACGIVE